MTKTYKRNKQFKEAVSVYRFALTKWAWREKKTEQNREFSRADL